MATTATKTTARKTTARKTTARTTTARPASKPAAKPAAQRAVRNGQAAATDARKALRTFVRESGYAYVGVGDAAVQFVRALPERSERLASKAGDRAKALVPTPARLQGLAKDNSERLTKLLSGTRTTVTREFDGYVVRGKKVVDSIRDSAPTKRALDQSKTARSQVKAAVTSVRKAVDQSADAVEAAADKVGSTA